MKIKCEYCEQMIEDTDPQCPYCGAVNENVKRGASQVPTTIDELKSFCAAHNMPLEKMRFFIGEDYKGARAFGIFQDGNGDFVVYKNKDNGQRAVRYKGKDEAYAVNEIYQKLKSEVLDRRNVKVSPGQGNSTNPQDYPAMQKKDELRRRRDNKKRRKKSRVMSTIITVAVIVLIAVLILMPDNSPSSGYYRYNGHTYYNQRGSWYMYDDGDWTSDFDLPDSLADDDKVGDYYESISYSDDFGATDFQESDYYVETSSYDDDDWDSDSWDSDDSWDSGGWDDWDSGSTDWDSDW